MGEAKSESKMVPTWLGLVIIVAAVWLVSHLVTGGEDIAEPYVSPADRAEAHARRASDQAKARARVSVSASLKDGRSAQFQNESVKSVDGATIVCGEVNAKNGFGAYNGYTPFAYSSANDLVFSAATMESPEAFQEVWSAYCT